MKQLPRILFFVVLGVLLLAVGRLCLLAEPSYQGKTLTEWLKARIHHYPEARWEAERAIRHIGSNAIPTLLSYAAAPKDSPLKKRILKWNNQRTRFRIPISSQFEKLDLAETGFFVLGPDAKSAVPGLIRLLGDDDVSGKAAYCLGSIGPAAEPAVPDLIKLWQRALHAGNFSLAAAWALGQIGPSAQAAAPFLKAGLTNNSRVASQAALINIHAISISPVIEQLKDITNTNWNFAVAVVIRCGTNALPAVPVCISLLKNTNNDIQRICLGILGRQHQDPDACIPAIVPFLNSENGELRQGAIDALRGFGKAAKPAIPALLRCLDDTQYKVRESVTNALLEIEPEVAAKAAERVLR